MFVFRVELDSKGRVGKLSYELCQQAPKDTCGGLRIWCGIDVVCVRMA